MESTCPICKHRYDGVACTRCTITNLVFGELGPTESLKLENQDNQKPSSTASLVDLVSNRKIPVATPYCKVGRDNLNDIVISGDPSISRFHFIITKENDQYLVKDSDSRHGTFLNGNRITASDPIHDGDVIKVGVSLFWFVIENTPALSTDNGPQAVKSVDIEMNDSRVELTAAQTEIKESTKSDLSFSRGSTADAQESGSSDTNDVEITRTPSMDPWRKQPIQQPGSKKEEARKKRESSKIKQKTSATTLEKLFETVNQRANHSTSDSNSEETTVSAESADVPVGDFRSSLVTEDESKPRESKPEKEESSIKHIEPTTNGVTNIMSMVKEANTSTVPDWLRRFFSAELIQLSTELTELSEQVKLTQQKMREVEERIKTTKELRNALLTSHGSELVGACGRVLTMLGFNIKPASDDQQELCLKDDDNHFCLARIVRPGTQADRTDLGQLSILQTRYWCEEGVEPKGILIISQSGNEPPSSLTPDNYNTELADYAAKKNVCLITTLQMLALYKELILNNEQPASLRATIMSTDGWLASFNLEPGKDLYPETDEETNKPGSLIN